jgi:hypothetical protein
MGKRYKTCNTSMRSMALQTIELYSTQNPSPIFCSECTSHRPWLGNLVKRQLILLLDLANPSPHQVVCRSVRPDLDRVT